MSREAAEKLFSLFRHPKSNAPASVALRLQLIEKTAAEILAGTRSGNFVKADVKRWVLRHMKLCSETFEEPAPASLVALAAKLMNVKAAPRKAVKNREKWNAVAQYVADNPEATVSAIRRAIGYDQPAVIKRWLVSPEFIHEVNARRRGG